MKSFHFFEVEWQLIGSEFEGQASVRNSSDEQIIIYFRVWRDQYSWWRVSVSDTEFLPELADLENLKVDYALEAQREVETLLRDIGKRV